ncbi:MAG: SurA N-terminal domain-containing protein [Aridibacter famidurans]|nr:SurA N-terminal domain-containing protein [Aridibacter famidurans]
MLKFFKRMERTRNIILVVFAVLLVVSLIVFGALQPGTQENLLVSNEVVAQVGDETVTLGELATQQQTFQQRQQNIPANFLLDGLIRQKMVKNEAERLGLTASDAEVADAIREIFKPEDGQPFDQARYEQIALRQAGSVSAYEESIRDELSAEKVRAFVTAGVRVSEAEVLEDFRRKNTKFDLSYVAISTGDIAEGIQPTDEELAKYFEENKKDYYISLPQKKIRYVYLETAKVGETLNLTDEILKAEYDKLPPERRQKGVNVQEIVLRVASPDFDAAQLEKANQIVQSLRQGQGGVTEERFAEVAKGQSEKPSTATNGGRVTGLVRPNPSNPDDPYQRILTMKDGEITEPIKFGSDYYILRRGKAEPKSFEEMKKELEVGLRNRRAYAANSELAQKVAARLKEVKDVDKVAQEFAGQANMSVANMVKETGYVKPGDEVEGFGVSQDFEQGIAPLEEKGQVGDRIPVPGGFAIPMLVDKRDPRDATLDEVRQRVVDAYKVAEARKRIEQIAKEIASGAQNAEGLSAAASSKNLEAADAADFILGSPLGEGPTATTSEALEEAIYSADKGGVTGAIQVGDNWYVVGVKDREEASTEDFNAQRDSLVEQMLLEKRGRVFSDYLAAVRRRMEQSGEIVIYKEVLAKLEAQNQQEAPAPQFPGGIPMPPPQSVPIPQPPTGDE